MKEALKYIQRAIKSYENRPEPEIEEIIECSWVVAQIGYKSSGTTW